jgi:MFS transporter, SHS family, lactate transporter
MQIALFGTWGVVPVYLNEISPSENRGTFPGFVYQLGNLLASVSARLQSEYAVSHGDDYATTIAVAAIASALSIAVLAGFGTERRGVPLNTVPQVSPEPSARAATGVMT